MPLPMKQIFRVLRWMVFSVALYFGAAVVGAFWPGGAAQSGDVKSETIGLLRGPIHYDLLLPLDGHTFEFLESADLPLQDPRAKWIMVGWGAGAFYTTVGGYQDVTLGAVVRGVLGDVSVMRFDVLGDVQPGPHVTFVRISPTQRKALEARILAELASDQPMEHPGLSPTDVFFPARSRFHIFRTCNVWIGQVLRDAGMRFGAWTPLPFSVTLALKRFGHT